MRLEKAVGLLEELNLDALLIVNLTHPFIDPNFEYLLRPKSGVFEYSFLVVEREGAKLFTSKLEEEAAKELGVEVRVIKELKDVLRYLKRLRRVGVNGAVLNHRISKNLAALGVALVDVSEELERIREIKEEDEVEAIRRAVRVTEEAIRRAIDLDIRRMREAELAAELVYQIARRGAGLAFEPIVAYDENAALPHYRTGSKDRLPEKVVLIDVGARLEHYCADITRTFILRRDREILEAYETVLKAQQAAIDRIREGVTAEEVDAAARKITEERFPGRFIHSLGHMIGVTVHEGRRLRPGEKYRLKEGMVFTVEPGVYIPGDFGIRIEDDVVVRENGCEVLSAFPKEVDEVTL